MSLSQGCDCSRSGRQSASQTCYLGTSLGCSVDVACTVGKHGEAHV